MSTNNKRNESTSSSVDPSSNPEDSHRPQQGSTAASLTKKVVPNSHRLETAHSMDAADTLHQQHRRRLPTSDGTPALAVETADGALRMRAHTEPVGVWRPTGSVGVGVLDQATADPKTSTTSTDTPQPSSSSSSSATNNSKHPKEQGASNDEEIERAIAMAQAIQNNPDMTPDEIRELLAREHITTSAPVVTASAATKSSSTQGSTPPLVPARLTNMMFSASATTSSDSAFNNKVSFRERARGRFTELLSGTNSRIVSAPAAAPLTDAVAAVEDEDLSMSATTTTMEATMNRRGNEMLATGASSITTTTTTSSPKDGVLRLPFRHSHAVKNARSPPISPRPTDTPEIVSSTTQVPTTEATMIPILQSASDQQQHNVGGSAASVASMSQQQQQQQRSSPIRISGIAWKRRGGIGKYSTTAAWERRRIELQGTKLLYYLRDASEEDDTLATNDYKDDDDNNNNNDVLSSLSGVKSSIVPATVSEDAQDAVSEGVVVTKRSTWLEQAASNWVASNEDPTAPRGFIDLAKEKATVHAAFGHSGAPSPFALSIKVRGETKWKLCFDYHKTQMEWLAAITDVVVQSSVDSYNALLLQSVDPSHQLDNAIFAPPSVSQPPSKGADGGHRLWSVDSYVCSNLVGINSSSSQALLLQGGDYTSRTDDDEPDEFSGSENGVHGGGGDEEHAQEHERNVTEIATKAWIIPDKHILYVVGVLNIALVHARASSMTMEGFWYLVVLANLGLYLCLSKEPDWRSVLTLAVRTASSLSLSNCDSPSGQKRSKGTKGLRRKRGATSAAADTKQRQGPKYVPTAGCSTIKLDQPTDEPVNSKGQHFAGWRSPSGDTLLIRSHGYLATKQKVSSPGELYELLTVDIFESPSRYPDMGLRVKLPKAKFNDERTKKTWRSPDIFIISIALPTDPPKMGRTSSDGGGYTITMYYGMKQQTRDILKRVTGDGYDPSTEQVDDPQKSQVNAVRLLEEWCRRAPTDPKFQSRFKVVPNAHNLREIGMPGWISKYNGKPFLIKRPGQTGFLYSHPELSCMEFDISLHPFPYLAKQAICFMKDSYFKRILVTFGFVIEGRSDDELPECLIGLMQLCYPDPQYAIQADEFFAGTSHRSFD